MKALPILLSLAAFVATASATPSIVIVQPPSQSTVISRLTPPTAQANQQLLNQVSSTLGQRRFEHQLTTVQAAIRAQGTPAGIAPAVVIQPK